MGGRLGLIDDEAWAEYEQKQARMAALERLLITGKVDAENVERGRLGRADSDGGTDVGATAEAARGDDRAGAARDA